MTAWAVVALVIGLAVGIGQMVLSERCIKYGPAVFLPVHFVGMCTCVMLTQLWIPSLGGLYLSGFTIALATFAWRGYMRHGRPYDG